MVAGLWSLLRHAGVGFGDRCSPVQATDVSCFSEYNGLAISLPNYLLTSSR